MRHLNVCGFVYSGKTALTEYLAAFEEVLTWPGRETRIARYPYSLGPLLDALNGRSAITAEDIQHLADLLLGQLADTASNPSWKHFNIAEWQWVNDNMAEVRALFGGNAWGQQVESLCAGLNAILHLPAADDARLGRGLRLIHGFTMGYLGQLALQEPGKSWLMYNNAFHPWNIRLCKIFPGSTTLVIDRDPRDQWCDSRATGLYDGDLKSSAEKFTKVHGWRRERFGLSEPSRLVEEGALTTWFGKSRVLQVSFDRFVTDAAVRDRVAAELKLDTANWNRAGHSPFAAERSAQNVGLWRRHPEFQEAFALIEARLGAYLFQPG